MDAVESSVVIVMIITVALFVLWLVLKFAVEAVFPKLVFILALLGRIGVANVQAVDPIGCAIIINVLLTSVASG